MKVGDLVKILDGPRIGIPKDSIGLIVKHYLVKYDEIIHSLYEVQLCRSGRQIKRFGEDLEVLTKK